MAWSMLLMRTKCRSGTRHGMAAESAGLWKACALARTANSASISGTLANPASTAMPKTSENSPVHPSARTITRLRLNRSAATPPRGLSNATGRSDAAEASESHTAEEVVSVMYQIAAKLAAQVEKIDTAWPLQMIAMRASQFCGRGFPCASAFLASRMALVDQFCGRGFPRASASRAWGLPALGFCISLMSLI